MLFRDVVDLIASTPGENDIGDPIEVDAPPRQVFANKKSVRQSEFYQAMANGLRPELMFEIREADYGGEAKLQFEGKAYIIIRTYPAKNELLEIICSGLVNGVT